MRRAARQDCDQGADDEDVPKRQVVVTDIHLAKARHGGEHHGQEHGTSSAVVDEAVAAFRCARMAQRPVRPMSVRCARCRESCSSSNGSLDENAQGPPEVRSTAGVPGPPAADPRGDGVPGRAIASMSEDDTRRTQSAGRPARPALPRHTLPGPAGRAVNGGRRFRREPRAPRFEVAAKLLYGRAQARPRNRADVRRAPLDGAHRVAEEQDPATVAT